MKTLNSVSDFAVIHYAWSGPILPREDLGTDPGLPGKLVQSGMHFVSFQRSKSIGGSATIEFFSIIDNLELGDWIVLKVSSKAKMTQANYAKTGIVKFIGQISSVSLSHFADADGNLRTTGQVVVREWSHALNMPVKYEQLSALVNSQAFLQLDKLLAKAHTSVVPGSKDSTALVEKYLAGKFNPFQCADLILSMAGAISRDVTRDGVLPRLETTHRLPSIPKSLLEDTIVAFAPRGTNEYEWISPWDTGAIAQLIGVQKTTSVTKLENVNSSLETYVKALALEKNVRPGKYFDRPALNSSFGVVEAIQKASGSDSLYEMYTDLVYTKDKDQTYRSTPAFIVRDKPLSFQKLWTSPQAVADSGGFGWTYIDFIPRVSVDSASVLSIGINQNISQAYNLFVFTLDPQSFRAVQAHGQALTEGVRVNIASQFRFGTQVLEEAIKDYLVPTDLVKPGVGSISKEWFRALSVKCLNFYTHSMLFPTANIHLKDMEYPISVGNMISIVLPTGLEIVGEVERINSQIKVQGDGKQTNDTYLEISKLSMVDTDNDQGLLMPIPPRVLKNLLKTMPTKEEKENILKIWKFRQ